MQVGITQIIMPGTTSVEFARQAAATGYEVVELCLKREGDLTPQASPAQLKELAAQVRAASVEPVSLVHAHVTGNVLESGDSQRTAIDETCRGLEVAAEMGIGCTLHTLGRLNPDLYY